MLVSAMCGRFMLQVNAAVQTTSNEAIDRFVVKSRDGPIDFERVRNAVLTHAVYSWSLPGQARPAAADEATNASDPSASVDVTPLGDRTDHVLVKVSCSDRPGILGVQTSVLESLGVSVLSAEINTLSGGRVFNTFTCKRGVKNQTEEMLRDAILEEIR